ncbi:hypothetical protein ACFWBI_10815 [Streptomyces sp. NPDC059982]|uniref:hypothetical protein n=1 Tax=unclassified Streptomyces TaxID=2593676 RepID=UPI003674EE1C
MNQLLRIAVGAATTVTALCALAGPAVAAGPAASAPAGFTASSNVLHGEEIGITNTSWGNSRPTPELH